MKPLKSFIKISALGGPCTISQGKWVEIWTVEFVQITHYELNTNFDERGEASVGVDDNGEVCNPFMTYSDHEGGWFLREDFAKAYGFMEGPWSDILLTPTVED